MALRRPIDVMSSSGRVNGEQQHLGVRRDLCVVMSNFCAIVLF